MPARARCGHAGQLCSCGYCRGCCELRPCDRDGELLELELSEELGCVDPDDMEADHTDPYFWNRS